jgi:hypothetical protein
MAWKLLLTNVGQILLMAFGLLLFIVPGLFVIAWLMFAAPIVVLEGKWGFEAYRRSKRLGDGFHWRNIGVVIALGLSLGVIFALLGAFFGVVLPDFVVHWTLRILSSGVGMLMQPFIFIVIVLLYYDMRVRKESYDAAALAETLRH